MKLFFYGTRGSIPTPLLLKDYKIKIKKVLSLYNKHSDKSINNFLKSLPFEIGSIYGGNTACLRLEEKSIDSTQHIILDAGSGIRVYGNEVAKKSDNTFHIFITHFHWDHICGLPFFKPIYNPTNRFIFYSPFQDMADNLKRLFHPAHFPVIFDNLPAKKDFVKLEESSEYELLGFKIKSVPSKHPGGSFAYVFSGYDKKFSYITDAEFTPDSVEVTSPYFRDSFANSDLVVMDSQYHVIEFFNKFDWGHTSTNMAVNLTLDWNIKRLVMFHFDPDHSDEYLRKILKEAKEQRDFLNKKLKVYQAIEGTYIEF